MASEQVPTKRLTGVDIAKRKGGPKVVGRQSACTRISEAPISPNRPA